MSDPRAVVEGLTEASARALRPVTGGMAAGIVGFAAFVAWSYAGGGTVEQPNAARFINIMTMAAMAWSLAGIMAAEFMWRRTVRAIERPADADASVQTAYILRLALREGGALLGLVVCFLACGNGVLRAYPAYWVNAAPAVLFLFFVYVRWPTLENLRAQVREAMPFV